MHINIRKNKKIFIITGYNSFINSGAKPYFKKFLKNRDYQIFYKKEWIPQYKELVLILNKINSFNPDYIFGIGGGSVLDYSKLAKNFINQKNLKFKIKNNLLMKKNSTKLFLFPTTAGSGSEATTFSVIYFDNKKISYDPKRNCVDKIIYIPKVLMNCDKKNRASSGIDAFNQSVESIFSKGSTRESIKYSKKSINILLKNLVKHIKKPNKSTSLNMGRAAFYSGKAINIAKTNAPHALSYPLTYYYNIKHGNAVSLTSLRVLKFNYKNINKSENKEALMKKFNIVHKIFKAKNIEDLEKKIRKIYKDSYIDLNFKDYKIEISKARQIILKNINLERLNNNPIKIRKIDLINNILID